MPRAYSLLHIKAVDATQRIVEGIATTPTPDLSGDVMDPLGAQFTLPLPFLWFHDSKDPIGEVFAADVTPDGIFIKARVATVTKPGRLKALVDEAWAAFTADPPLVRGLSIGWKEIESEPIRGTTFTKYLKWIWGELSAVTIPMNTEATILAVKQLDTAASGPTLPGVTGVPIVKAVKTAKAMMTTTEQITQFENTRASKAARMADLMTKAAETGSTLDQAQTDEYDALALEVKSVDAHLVRLREQETLNLKHATTITTTTSPTVSADLRGGHVPVIQVKSMLPKGTAFARYVQAIAASRGDKMYALELTKQWDSTTPEVGLFMKAAVAPGTTTDATWAAPLMPAAQSVMGEFLDLLRPATILGKLTQLTKVPFNVAVTSQTGGGTYNWVGQAKPKPVSALAFAKVTLGFAKIAGIIVITDELAKFSSPSAEARVRDDMVKGTAQFMDAQFIDPAVAAVVGVNPASITNGIAPIASSGVTPAFATTDIKALAATFTAAGLSLTKAVLIMSEANAFALSTARDPLGHPQFDISVNGGSIFGIPVITSQAAGSMVILVDQEGILYADDGATTIDVSREASLQMDGAPMSPADATTVYRSLWQENLIGLRAERYCTWLRARLASVAHISGAAYV